MPTMKESLSQRLNQDLAKIQPKEIRAFDAKVSAMPDMIKLTLGEPDFDVPEVAKAAAVDSITANDSHYAPGNGSVVLREAATDFLADRYGLTYDADTEVVITIGATEAIYATLTAVLNPGDKVLIPTPTFPLYDAITLMNGGEPVYLDTSATGFVLTPAQLRAAIAEHGDAIKAIVLNYPSNPTGVTYSAAELKALATVLAETDIIVIADEIYSELVYETTDSDCMAYISLEGGVGGAILMNGVPYTGLNGRSGEFGHICVQPEGLSCKCGLRGCLEAYCSSDRISTDLGISVEQFFAGLEAGNLAYQTLWKDYLNHLASALATIRMVFDCRIVLGGYIAQYLTPFLKELRGLTASRDPFDEEAEYISLCHYLKHAVPLGAALHFINLFVEEL